MPPMMTSLFPTQELIGTNGCLIQEVPQASTGFSPFELLYGCQVRGPLDFLKDYWECLTPIGENVVAYAVNMRERLEEMSALTQETMTKTQQNQKK